MPELPEVEVVRRGLVPHLVGRTLSGARVLHPRPVRHHPAGADGFVAEMVGRSIVDVRRRGKYMWFAFADDDALVVHLGMSGQFRVDDTMAESEPHARVLFDFDDDGPQVRFVDQRMFGGLQISHGGAALPAEVAHIALDPFDPEFDRDAVVARIGSKDTRIKRVLLDQQVVSGIGNIYADEALWRARVHPESPTRTMSGAHIARVLDHAQQVMTEALQQGGTSFDALYVNVNGSSGYFARSLDAYGREGKPCLRCGTPMKRIQFTNRSSTLCPRCQRLR